MLLLSLPIFCKKFARFPLHGCKQICYNERRFYTASYILCINLFQRRPDSISTWNSLFRSLVVRGQTTAVLFNLLKVLGDRTRAGTHLLYLNRPSLHIEISVYHIASKWKIRHISFLLCVFGVYSSSLAAIYSASRDNRFSISKRE